MFRTYDTSAIRPKRSPIPAIIAIVILAVAAVAVIGGLIAFTRGCTSTPMAKKGAEVQIVIEEGEGAKSVAKTLADAGLIASQSEFTDRIAQADGDTTLHPGTYTLIGGQSVDEIIGVLLAPVKEVTFTVPEGCTLAQTADIVATASNGRIAAQDFIAAASDASVYAGSYPFLGSAGKNSLEGFLFPKTYPIAEDSTADSIIRSMLDQFGSETAGLDLTYATNRGLSFYDMVKLASIVEKESDADHRGEVASVFYNRLVNGWMLQSDATVAYIVGHDPTPDDINAYNDYNTYFIMGLPPTPINSPSLACMQAVCAPPETDYFYFYFEPDASGKMAYSFSATYEEHQQTYQ